MNADDVPVPTWVLGIVWAALLLAFLTGVLMKPSVETVMAAGAATLMLFYVAFDYLYREDDFEADRIFE